jgi:hypothetical protein
LEAGRPNLPTSGGSIPPWTDVSRISAASAKDVLDRLLDDRPAEVRRLHASHASACGRAAARLNGAQAFTFGAKAKSAEPVNFQAGSS